VDESDPPEEPTEARAHELPSALDRWRDRLAAMEPAAGPGWVHRAFTRATARADADGDADHAAVAGRSVLVPIAIAVVVVVLVVGGVALASHLIAAPVRTAAPIDPAALGDEPATGVRGTEPVAPEGPAAPTSTAPSPIVVAVAGAVVAPGVYHLPGGGRVTDAVGLAGGLAPDADVDRLNLAAALRDGDRVYVPHRGEADPPAVVSPDGGTAAGDDTATTHPAPIDINRASVEQLDALPGVGPSTAAAIVQYRDQHGPFRSLDDLGEVRGIGPAKLAQLRPLITL
jgi:competence protein ComEA